MAYQNALAVGGGPLVLANLCMVYAYAGKQEEAQQILRQMHELRERGSVPALWVAYCHIGLGEVEEAFVWLEKALVERNGELVFLGAFPEWFFPFRQDPRFCRPAAAHRVAGVILKEDNETRTVGQNLKVRAWYE